MDNQTNKREEAEGRGEAMGYRVVLDAANCPACGKCIPACPKGIFRMVNKEIVITNNGITCNGCSECIDACRYDAIDIQYPNR